MATRSLTAIGGKGGKGGLFFFQNRFTKRSVGGRGGDGGAVFWKYSSDPLLDFACSEIAEAEDGQSGGNEGMRGRNGKDKIIVAPRDYCLEEVLPFGRPKNVISYTPSPVCLARGGIGGLGNAAMGKDLFQCGLAGETRHYELKARIVADLVLFGLPNCGKSTLFKSICGIDSKIMNYPYTTTSINYALVHMLGRKLVLADTPGITGAGDMTVELSQLLANAATVLVLVDVQRPETFPYLELLTSYIPASARVVKVASKADEQTVSLSDPVFDYYISCKTGKGINKIVSDLIR